MNQLIHSQYWLPVQVVLRILALLICTYRARKLNRSAFNWGLLAVVFPMIALIAIFIVKYKIAYPFSKDRVN